MTLRSTCARPCSGCRRRQRATLVLRVDRDLNVEQSAWALGCSAGTVKSQTAKGIEALRRALDAGPDRPGVARRTVRNPGQGEEARHG